MEENFYNILGVSSTANHDEIKKSFRNLSMKYHPDKNSSTESTQKFQKLNEAYQTLGDPEKRTQYDMMQQNPFMNMGKGFPPFQGSNPIDAIFRNMFSSDQMPPFPGVHIFHSGVNPDILKNLTKPPAIIKNLSLDISLIIEDSIIPIEIERWVMDNNAKVIEKADMRLYKAKESGRNKIIMRDE